MILIDDREKKKDQLLKFFPPGEARIERLDYGDFAFWGKGSQGAPIHIGVERKTIGDFISSMQAGRLSEHQVPGMLQDYDISYVLIEGNTRYYGEGQVLQELGLLHSRRWSGNGKGKKDFGWRNVQYGNRLYTRSEIEGYLHSLEIMTGVKIWKTNGMRDTVNWVVCLHNWWQKKWRKHKAVQQMRETIVPGEFKDVHSVRILAQIGGLGTERAQAAARHFGNILNACNATEKDWTEVPGIGKIIAKRCYTALREHYEEHK